MHNTAPQTTYGGTTEQLGQDQDWQRPHPAEIMPDDEAHATAQRIQERLDESGGYYVGGRENAMYASPDVFHVSQEEREAMEQLGRNTFDLVEASRNLYLAAITGRLDLPWLVEAVEGPLNDHQREVQRAVAIHEAGRLPIFARADLTSVNPVNGGAQCETQFRLGGLGLITTYQEAIRDVLPAGPGEEIEEDLIANVMADAIKEATDNEHPVAALIAPEKYVEEQEKLADYLGESGVRAVVIPRDQLDRFTFEGGRLYAQTEQGKIPVDFVYRREVNAATLAESEAGMAIVNAALADGVIVEPLLSMIYDTKVPLALAHDPRVAQYISDEARSAAPMTALLPGDLDTPFHFGGRDITLREIIGLSNSKRPFVVKYAGPSIEYGLGGRAVYTLDDMSKPGATELLEYGMSQVRDGHAWVAQIMDKSRYPARWLERDGQLHSAENTAARVMAFYRRHPDGYVKMFAGIGSNRAGHWKAAGSRESHVRMVRVHQG